MNDKKIDIILATRFKSLLGLLLLLVAFQEPCLAATSKRKILVCHIQKVICNKRTRKCVRLQTPKFLKVKISARKLKGHLRHGDAVFSEQELCDNRDNNCNGLIDDSIPGEGTLCATGKPGVCAEGRSTCSSGQVVCKENITASADSCNGLDDDCDGLIDNVVFAESTCPTGKAGVCAVGASSCVNGSFECSQGITPSPEVCNGLDDDCDGEVDEQLGQTSCGSGVCTVTIQNCVGGVPQSCNPNLSDGTQCNDNNACTTGEKCQAGQCGAPNSVVVCNPLDQCHNAGTCNPSTGICSNPNKQNGTACSDGNGCTLGETCTNGTCGSHTSIVTCIALDQCHVAGTCNPGTGTCSNPIKANGTSCNDGNLCTTGDQCLAGSCISGNPKTCQDFNACTSDRCNRSTGNCDFIPKNCDDDNPCTADSCNTLLGTCNNVVVVPDIAECQCLLSPPPFNCHFDNNSNTDVNGCACNTNGDCIGNCSCGNPCTIGSCPGDTPGNSSCITNPGSSAFGSCGGVCPPSSFNFCVGGGTNVPFCTDPFDNNSNLSADCCPCNTDGDCIGSCSNNNQPNTIGVCVSAV